MKTFYVGIKGVIVKENKVLMLRANAAAGRRDIWEMPGGRIDDEETIEQALRRELQEELDNIRDVEVREILHAHRLNWNIDGDKSLLLVFYRVNASFDGDPQISDEHIDWIWADEATALDLAEESTRPALIQALR